MLFYTSLLILSRFKTFGESSDLKINEKCTVIDKNAHAIQELISHRPGFLEQWALPVFLLVLAALLAGTWYIRYPEVVQASASLTADNAPKEIVTRQDGRLISLVVANDELLSEGQTIGWIESTASHKEVLLLDSLLARGAELLSGGESEKVSALFEKSFHNLGELQTAYQQFVQAWQQFNDYLANGYFHKKKKMLHEDLAYLEKMHGNLDSQIGLANYNRAIQYRSGLKSQALVVTRNTRLIERLFNNVLKMHSLN